MRRSLHSVPAAGERSSRRRAIHTVIGRCAVPAAAKPSGRRSQRLHDMSEAQSIAQRMRPTVVEANAHHSAAVRWFARRGKAWLLTGPVHEAEIAREFDSLLTPELLRRGELLLRGDGRPKVKTRAPAAELESLFYAADHIEGFNRWLRRYRERVREIVAESPTP